MWVEEASDESSSPAAEYVGGCSEFLAWIKAQELGRALPPPEADASPLNGMDGLAVRFDGGREEADEVYRGRLRPTQYMVLRRGATEERGVTQALGGFDDVYEADATCDKKPSDTASPAPTTTAAPTALDLHSSLSCLSRPKHRCARTLHRTPAAAPAHECCMAVGRSLWWLGGWHLCSQVLVCSSYWSVGAGVFCAGVGVGWSVGGGARRYECAACGLPLYTGAMKFDCGCGWPGFFECIPDAVFAREDHDGVRHEVVCNGCNR